MNPSATEVQGDGLAVHPGGAVVDLGCFGVPWPLQLRLTKFEAQSQYTPDRWRIELNAKRSIQERPRKSQKEVCRFLMIFQLPFGNGVVSFETVKLLLPVPHTHW